MIKKLIYSIIFLCSFAGCKKKYVEVINTIKLEHLKSPVTSDLNSVCFLTTSLGYFAGDSGKVYKTTDAGTSWVNISLPVKDYIYKILFTSETSGFAGTSSGLYKTSNGGQTWEQEGSIYKKIRDIWFVNNNIGYAVSQSFYLDLYSTKNGGKSWSSSSVPGFTANKIHFINEDTGYVLTDKNEMLQTIDAGYSWNVRYDDLSNYSLTDFYSASPDNFYFTGTFGELIRKSNSIDYDLITDDYSYNINTIDIYGSSRGIAVGENIILIPESDILSQRWKVMQSPDGSTVPYTYYDVTFADETIIYAVGKGGIITKFNYPN